MKKRILIVGGIKSGKSEFALSFFKNKKAYFIATAQPKDSEMKKKINFHRKRRPKNFLTIEEPIKIVNKIKNFKKNSAILIDCVNIWIANMLNKYSENEILTEVKSLCECLKKFKLTVLVSNEVGMSLVAVNRLGRKFQELLGKVNQILSDWATDVYFLITGIPVKIK
ncbi:MAG: bifunctional adenosylcobinamide kinase/adenosylcobinamide-phosphate guanylyltransferase [Endomicrobiia bacterium]